MTWYITVLPDMVDIIQTIPSNSLLNFCYCSYGKMYIHVVFFFTFNVGMSDKEVEVLWRISENKIQESHWHFCLYLKKKINHLPWCMHIWVYYGYKYVHIHYSKDAICSKMYLRQMFILDLLTFFKLNVITRSTQLYMPSDLNIKLGQ